ncbi:MFS transporter small subunit [Deinococcus sp.]
MNQDQPVSPALIYFAWLLVGVPLAWGVYQTLIKVVQLFG